TIVPSHSTENRPARYLLPDTGSKLNFLSSFLGDLAISLVSNRSAVHLHGRFGAPMREVSEYEQNAQACLKLAAIISDPEHKTMLLHMADSWTMLAHGHKKRLSQDHPLSNCDDATDEE